MQNRVDIMKGNETFMPSGEDGPADGSIVSSDSSPRDSSNLSWTIWATEENFPHILGALGV